MGFKTNKIQTGVFPLDRTPEVKDLIPSTGTQNQMHATLRIDDTTNLSDAQRERCILERLLHLPRFKPSQVSIVVMGGTVRVFARNRTKLISATPDFRFVSLQDHDGIFLRARDFGLPGIPD